MRVSKAKVHFYKVMLPTLSLRVLTVCFLLSTSSIVEAQIPHTLKCRGDLPMSCIKNNSQKAIQPIKDLTEIYQQDCIALRVGGTANKPFMELSPWAGIQYRTFQANIPKSFEITLKEESGEDFLILLRSEKTKYRKELRCLLKHDLRGTSEKK